MRRTLITAMMVLAGTAAAAQLPGVALPRLPKAPLDPVIGAVGDLPGIASRLVRERLSRLDALIRAHPRDLVMTGGGPAVRGEIIAIEPDAATRAAAERLGLRLVRTEAVEDLGLTAAVYAIPAERNPDDMVKKLRKAAPDGAFEVNHLYFQSGQGVSAGGPVQFKSGVGPGAIGVIDGGVAEHPVFSGPVEQMGFAAGGPAPSAHGTAVAALAVGSAPMRAPAPGAPLLVADVYGRDPKGGNALAIARALGWMASRRAGVVAMSLAGPDNALVARAVAAAQARGLRIVASAMTGRPRRLLTPPLIPVSSQ
jgi:minor extracellular protease Epr